MYVLIVSYVHSSLPHFRAKRQLQRKSIGGCRCKQRVARFARSIFSHIFQFSSCGDLIHTHTHKRTFNTSFISPAKSVLFAYLFATVVVVPLVVFLAAAGISGVISYRVRFTWMLATCIYSAMLHISLPIHWPFTNAAIVRHCSSYCCCCYFYKRLSAIILMLLLWRLRLHIASCSSILYCLSATLAKNNRVLWCGLFATHCQRVEGKLTVYVLNGNNNNVLNRYHYVGAFNQWPIFDGLQHVASKLKIEMPLTLSMLQYR